VHKQGTRDGVAARGMNPRGVSQIGSSMGNHTANSGKALRGVVEPVRGATAPKGGPGGVALGNAAAKNVGAGGPGAGRVVYGSGTQGQHGAAAGSPKPAGRDILSDFGPDSAAVRDRR
jgi:hypothetical protein